ncbi:hypothetical protein [Adlercreutzia sp. ZJ154]|uniref:hypothetical protein n=1 Tax=Adlercreutzia sp. ZJ154 TaxID=2709790 RepID=UPI0013EB7DB9|nr:hypothetical protein [Adlercreutzia sp. ZJ154]
MANVNNAETNANGYNDFYIEEPEEYPKKNIEIEVNIEEKDNKKNKNNTVESIPTVDWSEFL